MALRVPCLNRKELTLLASTGALNSIDGVAHRRDALWQMERAGKMEGPLFRQQSDLLQEEARSQPLQKMNVEERLVADYGGTGMTIGKHPMHYRRHTFRRQGAVTASDLQKVRNGAYVKSAGLAIVKQRPGTAKGVVFMSAADETGIFNIIVSKDFFENNKLTIKRCKFFMVEGKLQSEDGVIHIQAKRLTQLSNNGLALASHDFH
jgi:error-prone DNA polymerase